MLKAIALNCSLKRSQQPSSTDKLLGEIAQELRAKDVETEILRVVDFDVKPGVSSDEGDGDQWPQLRARIVESDILLLGTPVWLGQPSSVVKRVLERLDAFLGETDDAGTCPLTARSRPLRWSATRTARTTCAPSCSRR